MIPKKTMKRGQIKRIEMRLPMSVILNFASIIWPKVMQNPMYEKIKKKILQTVKPSIAERVNPIRKGMKYENLIFTLTPPYCS